MSKLIIFWHFRKHATIDLNNNPDAKNDLKTKDKTKGEEEEVDKKKKDKEESLPPVSVLEIVSKVKNKSGEFNILTPPSPM